jgi:hypothetical protein
MFNKFFYWDFKDSISGIVSSSLYDICFEWSWCWWIFALTFFYWYFYFILKQSIASQNLMVRWVQTATFINPFFRVHHVGINKYRGFFFFLLKAFQKNYSVLCVGKNLLLHIWKNSFCPISVFILISTLHIYLSDIEGFYLIKIIYLYFHIKKEIQFCGLLLWNFLMVSFSSVL